MANICHPAEELLGDTIFLPEYFTAHGGSICTAYEEEMYTSHQDFRMKPKLFATAS